MVPGARRQAGLGREEFEAESETMIDGGWVADRTRLGDYMGTPPHTVLTSLVCDTLRVRPGTLTGIAEFSEHETDGSELEEGEPGAVEVLPVLG